jgi:chromosome partitioning protein
LLLEDVQGELYVREARQSKDPDVVGSRVRGRLERMLRRFEGNFDVVILDCAPGLSFAALAALKTAQLVLVPFRPDYVSQLAVDRVALLIEGKRTGGDLAEIPIEARRYACVANAMRDTGRERNIYDEIALDHPMMTARLPQSAAIADAFDFRDDPRRIEEKYGDATGDVRAMYEEVASRLTMRLAA